MAADIPANEIQMDLEGLYLEEMFTDRRVGSIMRLTPVDSEGGRDSSREILYVGQSQVMTPAGALPLNFEIEAGSLEEAVKGFGEAASAAVNDTMEQLKQLRREAASSLIVPEAGGGGFGGPGGGKIQLR
jgi:hypothetical protein